MNAKKIFAIALAAVSLASCGPANPTATSYTSKVSKSIETPAFGATESPKVVTMKIFSDFQCPGCQNLHLGLDAKLRKDYVDTGKIHLEYKNFPLTQHQNAFGDALAGLYAHSKGKYLEFAEKMFALEISKANAQVTDAERADVIASLGLDRQEFLTSLSEGWYVDEVNKEVSEGEKLGLRATPSVYLDGVLMNFNTEQEFFGLIDAAIAAKK